MLPDVIAGDDENAFDLAGMVLGYVKGKPILGNAIRPGDVILGIESSGLHSNGYTLARKVLLSKYSVDDNADHLVQTVGEELLVPYSPHFPRRGAACDAGLRLQVLSSVPTLTF